MSLEVKSMINKMCIKQIVVKIANAMVANIFLTFMSVMGMLIYNSESRLTGIVLIALATAAKFIINRLCTKDILDEIGDMNL